MAIRRPPRHNSHRRFVAACLFNLTLALHVIGLTHEASARLYPVRTYLAPALTVLVPLFVRRRSDLSSERSNIAPLLSFLGSLSVRRVSTLSPVRVSIALALAALGPFSVREVSALCPIGINMGLHDSSQYLSVKESVAFIRDAGFSSLKIFAPDEEVFAALAGTGMELVLGVYPLNLTTAFALSPGSADQWVEAHVVPWISTVNITTLAVANEVIAPETAPAARHVVPGMWALHAALRRRGLDQRVKVKTPQHPGFLCNISPPSAAYVVPSLRSVVTDLLQFVTTTGSSLFLTTFPFWSIKYNPYMKQSYVFFQGLHGFYDKGGFYYQNRFDVMVDAVLVAAAKLGYACVDIAIAEAGWPTAGDPLASVRYAEDWNQRLLGKVCSGQGTPRRPGQRIQTWLFEAFDEPWKNASSARWEAHWGIWAWDGGGKYSLSPRDTYPAPPVRPPAAWCVVKEGAEATAVVESVAWACSKGGVQCAGILERCDKRDASSAVYNADFQKHFQQPGRCNFSGTGVVTTVSPYVFSTSACPFPGRPG